MSSISSVGSSSDVSYATNLAKAALLKRNLNSLDSAIQTGNLTSASSILASMVKANPQYAASSTDASSGTTDPINADFQAVSQALDGSDAAGAKTAWAQLKTDLGKSGITINDGTADTAKLLSQTKTALDQAIISGMLGGSSSGSLLGSLTSASGTGNNDLLNSVMENWVTYKAGGETTTPPSLANALDQTA